MAGVTTLPLLKGTKGSNESNENGEKSCYLSSTGENSNPSASGPCACPLHPLKLLQNLNFQRQKGSFCDVEIVADGMVIRVSFIF